MTDKAPHADAVAVEIEDAIADGNASDDSSLKDAMALAIEIAEAVADDYASDDSSMTTVDMTGMEDADGTDRCCWICFASDEDTALAAWVKPCQCRGTTKWVHQSCLYRWVDEKMHKEKELRAISCPQCQTEYIIVFPKMDKVAGALEAMDALIKRICPFLAAGIFIGSLYWTAVTFGAVTVLQILGYEKGMSVLKTGDPVMLLIGLPFIPLGLLLGRLVRWEDAVVRLIHKRENILRVLPFFRLVCQENRQQEDELDNNNFPDIPSEAEPLSATSVFCGALIMPTISSIVGWLLFDAVENTLHRTLLGGLTFFTVKGILTVYLKHKQYANRKKRRIVDYTEENIRTYVHSNNDIDVNAAEQDQEDQELPL